jgi:serine/threonine protein kinase
MNLFFLFSSETDQETFEAIKKNELTFPDPIWNDISDDVKDLIRKMLDVNQETRIKAEDILKHQWVTPPNSKKNGKVLQDTSLPEVKRKKKRNSAIINLNDGEEQEEYYSTESIKSLINKKNNYELTNVNKEESNVDS